MKASNEYGEPFDARLVDSVLRPLTPEQSDALRREGWTWDDSCRDPRYNSAWAVRPVRERAEAA